MQRVRWQHTRVNVEQLFTFTGTALGEMGRDGWELVAVADGQAYFKRPIVETNDAAD